MSQKLSNLRIQEAANYIGVSAKTLRRWEKKGKLVPNRSKGFQRYYDKTALDNFLGHGRILDLPQANKSEDKKLLPAFKWLFVSLVLMSVVSYGVASSKNNQIKDKYLEVATKNPSVLAVSTGITGNVSQKYTFTVSVPARFEDSVTFDKDIIAPNVISSLSAGDGISVSGNKITSTITQGLTSLSAGTGISIDGNKITNTYSFTPDYTLSGWTDNGTSITLTTTTDTVTLDALTAGAITADSLTTGGLSLTSDLTVASGHSLLPSVDLGSDIGSSSFRFNNLWVANINSNSSQAFSGQTTFSYPPTDTTIDEASVLINPTTSVANGQLLGLAIAGYEKAVIDEDGDIILGYNSLTSAPATDYPLDIYGHSGTRVSFVDTSGNGYFAGNVGIGTTSPGARLEIPSTASNNGLRIAYGGTGGTTYGLLNIYSRGSSPAGPVIESAATDAGYQGIMFRTGSSDRMYLNTSGYLGIGTTSPGKTLDVVGSIRSQSTMYANTNLFIDGSIYNQNGFGGSLKFESTGPIFESLTAPKVTLRLKAASAQTADILQWLDSAGTVLGVINSSGSVGIGTTSPSTKLEVIGGYLSVADAESSGAGRIYFGKGALYGYGGTNPLYMRGNSGHWYLTGSGVEELHIDLNASSLTSITNMYQGDFVFENDVSNEDIYFKINDGGVDTTSLLIQGSSGNVGIGTTAPTSTLNVNGTTLLNTNSLNGIQFKYANAYQFLTTVDSVTNSNVLLQSSYDINYATLVLKAVSGQGAPLFRWTNSSNVALGVIDATGNVGIGTTSPTYQLEVKPPSGANTLGLHQPSDSTYLLKYFNDTFSTSTAAVSSYISNTGNFYMGTSTGKSINFTVGGDTSTKLYIDGSTGNVGIGTTSPSYNLDIYKNGTGSTAAVTGKDSGIAGDAIVSQVLFRNDNTSTGTKDLAGIGLVVNAYNTINLGDLVFSAKSGASSSSLTEYMRIKNASGNVGIGTTSPQSLLNIGGTGSLANGLTFGIGDVGIWRSATNTLAFSANSNSTIWDGTDYYPANDNVRSLGTTSNRWSDVQIGTANSSFAGNVGIGTTSPGEKLEIALGSITGTDKTGIMLSNSAAGLGDESRIEWKGGGGSRPTAYIGSSFQSAVTDGYLSFGTYNSAYSEALRITATGNVGIGTTSPGSKLEIGSSDLGDGLAGPVITLGRNTNATNSGAGSINYINKDGTAGFVWQDAGGLLRINTSAPTTANDTAGTVVGSQSSSLASKNVLGEFTDYPNALKSITEAPLYTFNYKSGAYNGEEFTGIITDYSPTFGMDNGKSLNVVNGLGYTFGAIKELNNAILTLQNSTQTPDNNSKFETISNLISAINSKIEDIKTKLDKFAEEIFTKKVHTEEICVGSKDSETCLTKEKLDEVLKLLPSASPDVVPTPTPEASMVPSATPSATTSPSASPVVSPEPSPKEEIVL